jgi:very-short-patch-repair endonuclease
MPISRQAPFDHRIAAFADGRHGVITSAQLGSLGLSRDAIDSRIRSGYLHRQYRGVYAVGRPGLTTEGRFPAVVVACGDRAVLSHTSAAILWGLLPERGPRIDVTVPSVGGRKRRRAVIVHRSPLPADDVTVKEAIPVTTPVRTLIDLADVLPRRALERALDEAAYLRLDLTGLRPVPGRRGAGLLASVLAVHDAGSTRTRSELEERMLALCRRAALPTPDLNEDVEGYETDFSWPDARLVVETDGWAAHGTRRAFEDDRLRDAELMAAGWRVLRVTRSRLKRDPAAVAAQLEKLLE